MKLRDVMDVLDAELMVGSDKLDLEIGSACGSDLMSDVMAYVKETDLLLTGLINPQVIRTAEIMDIKAVGFVRGKCLGRNITDLAKEKGTAVFSTKHPMFVACGTLYEAGITGKGV